MNLIFTFYEVIHELGSRRGYMQTCHDSHPTHPISDLTYDRFIIYNIKPYNLLTGMNRIEFDKKIFLTLIVIIKLALDIRDEIYIYIYKFLRIC